MARMSEEFRIVGLVGAASGLSQAEDAEVNSHCADLEARLSSLRSRQSPSRTEFSAEADMLKERRFVRNVSDLTSRFNVVETNVTEEPRIIELHNINVVPRLLIQEIVRSKPVVEVREEVRTVPRLEVREVERVVEVPHVQYVNKFIEVPEVRIVEKIVEVPQLHIQEVVKEVPRVQVHEIVRHIPRIEVREVLRQVPVVEFKVIEKIVEVPRIQTIEKIVEVPQVQTVEKIVRVPHVQTIEKIVAVEKIVQVERPVYVSVAPSAEKIEVLECVTVGSTQVPFLAETLLTSMSSSRLREHAFLLYNTLGHSRIGSPVPVAQTELISWITNVQRQHIEPFRGKAPPPAGYQPPVATRTAGPLQDVMAGVRHGNASCPLAVAGVDTTHDGFPNFLYVGADRNGDGIPDALQGSAVKSGSIKSGSISMTPRLLGPDRSAVGRPLQQRTITIGTTSSEVSAGHSRGNSSSLDQRSLGVTQCLGATSGSIGTGGSIGAPVLTGSSILASSGTTCAPTLGVTVTGRASGSRLPLAGSVSAPIGTPRRMTIGEVPLGSQTPGRYQAGPSRSFSQLSKSGSSSALLVNGNSGV